MGTLFHAQQTSGGKEIQARLRGGTMKDRGTNFTGVRVLKSRVVFAGPYHLSGAPVITSIAQVMRARS